MSVIRYCKVCKTNTSHVRTDFMHMKDAMYICDSCGNAFILLNYTEE